MVNRLESGTGIYHRAAFYFLHPDRFATTFSFVSDMIRGTFLSTNKCTYVHVFQKERKEDRERTKEEREGNCKIAHLRNYLKSKTNFPCDHLENKLETTYILS